MHIITMKNLEGAVRRLNNGVDSYQLDGAYGGWKLVQIVNKQGGQRDISCGGFVSKRELWNQIQAIIAYSYSQETVKA